MAGRAFSNLRAKTSTARSRERVSRVLRDCVSWTRRTVEGGAIVGADSEQEQEVDRTPEFAVVEEEERRDERDECVDRLSSLSKV